MLSGYIFQISAVNAPVYVRIERFHMTSRRPNRPFYRYGGHIELIRFKEYYRMPRGHEHIPVLFSSAFRDIFS